MGNREENPLKSVAQKICNIVIKGEKSKKKKSEEENKTNENDLGGITGSAITFKNMKYESSKYYTSSAKLGDFDLSNDFMSLLDTDDTLAPKEDVNIDGFHVYGSYYTNSANENDPEIGDPDSGIAPGTPFESLPDDWVCPLCGVSKDMFEKM